jgi:hypothetical protein
MFHSLDSAGYYTIGDFKLTLILGLLDPERLNKNTAGCNVKLPRLFGAPAKLNKRARLVEKMATCFIIAAYIVLLFIPYG